MTYPQFPPQAPADDPGEPPARPDSIVLALQLWVAVIVCQLVWIGGSYTGLREMVVTQLKDMSGEPGAPADPESVATAMTIAAQALAGVFMTALTLLVMFFVYRGAGWARLVLGWMSAFLVVMLVFDLIAMFVSGSDEITAMASGWAMIFRILGGVAALGAMVALMHADSARYCREVAEHRKRKTLRRGQ